MGHWLLASAVVGGQLAGAALLATGLLAGFSPALSASLEIGRIANGPTGGTRADF